MSLEVFAAPPKLSVVIPTYVNTPEKQEFFQSCLHSIFIQDRHPDEIVVSDHSPQDLCLDICKKFQRSDLRISYYRNTFMVGSSSANVNFGLSKATGQILKILFQDDFFFPRNALSTIASKHENEAWSACGCNHFDGSKYFNDLIPRWHPKIHRGQNTMSSPSVITINAEVLKYLTPFDHNLVWTMDIDFYTRMAYAFGLPKIIPDICVTNRLHPQQLTNTLSEAVKKSEETLMVKRYGA